MSRPHFRADFNYYLATPTLFLHPLEEVLTGTSTGLGPSPFSLNSSTCSAHRSILRRRGPSAIMLTLSQISISLAGQGSRSWGGEGGVLDFRIIMPVICFIVPCL
ncbi:hypothetical protein M409DRAFT_50945 [Zasmidium cellare ATCC 36951]|uniref:Uncharacterized protein n=1 Tax=Zasmidium cellare ATCC 36951 TaxID=1080233 RepID=A0A6A6CWW3_ZASCE|nr:uncharacterized protein M409DRAFT_50945 [Zasmidium cellare ATCC 36951]KAF2171515.1 hypothetical protein M409DRAFT_50945 [Zasmidium cellare ATCC 36951]